MNVVYVWRHSQCHCCIFYHQPADRWSEKPANTSQFPIRQRSINMQEHLASVSVIPASNDSAELTQFICLAPRAEKWQSAWQVHFWFVRVHFFWKTYLTSGLFSDNTKKKSMKGAKCLTRHHGLNWHVHTFKLICLCFHCSDNVILYVWKSFWGDVSVQTSSFIQTSS